jgi:hypothetical protein
MPSGAKSTRIGIDSGNGATIAGDATAKLAMRPLRSR